MPVSYEFDPRQLVFYAALGLACAVFAVLWLKLLVVTRDNVFRPLKVPV